jgi:enoyl-[acyl-carrier-protein] reductase (NADH)
MQALRGRHDRLEALISNVAFAPLARGVGDYTRKGLTAAIDYSAWPLVSHTQIAREVFGTYPRYVIGLSSQGVDSYHLNYDLVAAAKAVLETLCRYLHQRVRDEGARVNVVRTRFVDTASLRATFGDDFPGFVERHSPGAFRPPEEIGEAVFGLCSGLMDGVGGQVLSVDGGANVFENFSRLFAERDRLPPLPGRGGA